jgi:hypothetical protein
MSQLRKQSVIGRKTGRRISKSATSTATGGSSRWKGGFKKVSRFFGWLLLPFTISLKRWPRLTLIAGCMLVATVTLGYGTYRSLKKLTQSLPHHIEVSSPRSDLKSRISVIAEETLNTARKEKWSRTALTDKLLSRLSSVEGVDEITVRAGLDKKLRISVAAQAPLLVLQGKDGERILVGSQFKIIARGLGSGEYDHLLQVEAADLNLNIKSSRERKKANTGLFVRPSSSSSINIRWLSQQALRLQNMFLTEKFPVDVQKIVWRTTNGFSAIVKTSPWDQAHSSPAPVMAVPMLQDAKMQAVTEERHKLTIILGEGQFTEKFARLEQILQDLRSKKLHADQIDLAFSDKAVIRMSEQLSENTRGALQ